MTNTEIGTVSDSVSVEGTGGGSWRYDLLDRDGDWVVVKDNR